MARNRHLDVEVGEDRDGYPALARWSAANPDYETFIFRKFDRLSARNLLHLESQLIALEWQLDRDDEQARESTDTETARSIRTWEAFEENAKSSSRLEHNRMELANQVSEKLKQYHEAILLQAQVAAMDKPRKRPLDVLQNWFKGDEQQNGCQKRKSVLGGRAKEKLDDVQDLVALRRPADKDLLSRFLQDHWLFQTTLTSNQTEHIKERHVVWTVAIISTILAAVLLVGAIISLYLTKQAGTRLGLMAGFTALFALSVGLLTNAKRAEIFAATAAYAAVLVVFVPLRNEKVLSSAPSFVNSGR